MSIRDKITELTTQSVIALIVVIFGMIFLAFTPETDSKRDVSNFILIVLGYMFGASRATGKANETIQKMAEK